MFTQEQKECQKKLNAKKNHLIVKNILKEIRRNQNNQKHVGYLILCQTDIIKVLDIKEQISLVKCIQHGMKGMCCTWNTVTKY